MTNRERNIAITVAAVIGLAGLNQIVDGQLAKRSLLETQIQETQRGLAEENLLIRRKEGNQKKLTNLINTSLTRNQSDAEAQLIIRHLECLAQADINPVQAGFNPGSPSLVKINNKAAPKDATQFMRQNARVTLKNGNMSQVARYAYLINASDIPIRITDMQMTPTKANTDDFNVEFTLATVFLTQAQQEGARGGQAGAAGGGSATRASTSAGSGTNAVNDQNRNGATTSPNRAGRGARGALGAPTTTPTETRP